MKNEHIEKNQIHSAETKTNKTGSALPQGNSNPLSDRDLDGISGGAIYMKVDGIVKEDDPKVRDSRVQP